LPYIVVGTWWHGSKQKFQWSFKLKCETFARAKHKITAYKVAPTMKALEIIIKEFQGIPCHTMYTSSVEATGWSAAIRKIREDKVMEKERVPPEYQWHWRHENQSKTVCFLRVPAPFALYKLPPIYIVVALYMEH